MIHNDRTRVKEGHRLQYHQDFHHPAHTARRPINYLFMLLVTAWLVQYFDQILFFYFNICVGKTIETKANNKISQIGITLTKPFKNCIIFPKITTKKHEKYLIIIIIMIIFLLLTFINKIWMNICYCNFLSFF